MCNAFYENTICCQFVVIVTGQECRVVASGVVLTGTTLDVQQYLVNVISLSKRTVTSFVPYVRRVPLLCHLLHAAFTVTATLLPASFALVTTCYNVMRIHHRGYYWLLLVTTGYYWLLRVSTGYHVHLLMFHITSHLFQNLISTVIIKYTAL